MAQSIPTEDLSEFLTEFARETDRAAAVLAVAYLDSRLEVLLREKFVATPKFVKDVFTGQGGLSSFSAKISIAYAVGLISKRTADDLHIIRRIRNDFAHRLHGLSFEISDIADRVNKLSILKIVLDEENKPLLSGFTPRKRFDTAVVLILFKGIEARIANMPKFQEAESPSVIRATRF